MTIAVRITATSTCKRSLRQDLEIQTPLLSALNYIVQSYHTGWAGIATHSLDSVSNRTLAVPGYDVCHHQDWHAQYVVHARTYIVIAILMQTVWRHFCF
jgi:hypothetical protein